MPFCVAVDGTCNGSQIQNAGYQDVTPTAKNIAFYGQILAKPTAKSLTERQTAMCPHPVRMALQPQPHTAKRKKTYQP